jgi:PAS domain S-box-containing protein
MRQDGTRFWASVVIDPIYDEHGTLLGYAKITRDITEKRQAEQALRASEERFRLLVQGVTDYAIYMLSPAGEVTNWNVGAERIKGYSYDEIVGQHFSRFYTEEDRASGLPARAIGNAARDGRYEAEGWRVRKDGTRFWAHVVIDAIHDELGQLIGFAKITRDLTEKKKADAALAEANAALFQAQKMESIGQLTGGIAHDFNNLLSVLASGLEVLTLGRGGSADSKTFDSMRRAIDRGAALTQQLLAFARQQPLQPETRSVNRLISGFESVLRRAVNASIEFQVKLEPQVRTTVIDSARFESAILNLVVNARDAMPGEGTAITIFLPAAPGQDGAHQDGSELVLIVEDEPDLMDVAAALYISMGYDVVTASSAQEALGLLASREVDILFTDVIMPGKNGIELATYTRAHYPHVKVILASGYPLPALKLEDADLGDFVFVGKPYRLSDLARALRSAA